jgi:gliding motility-associated-like protein
MVLNIINYSCDANNQTYDVTFTLATNQPLGQGTVVEYRTTTSNKGTLVPDCVNQDDSNNPACNFATGAGDVICACDGVSYNTAHYVDFYACTGLTGVSGTLCKGTTPVQYSVVGVPIGQSVNITTILSAYIFPDVYQATCPYVVTIPSPPFPAQPGSIAGKVLVCGGEAAIYSVTAVANAISYNWDVPSGATITSGQGTNTIYVTFGNTGGDICVTAIGTCISSMQRCKTIGIKAAPVANLGADKYVCTGNTTTLDAANPGSTYLWSTSATTQTVPVSASGTYTVTVTQNGCSSSDVVVVTLLSPVSITNLTNTNLTGSFQVSGGLPAANGSNYANLVMGLQGNPGITATLTTAPFTNNETVFFTAPQAGTYQVVATDAVGCSGMATFNVSGNGSGTSGTAPCIEWQKALGGSGSDEAYTIQQTTDGGYIIAGNTPSNDGDISGNHGGQDIWVVKLNATGTIQWQKTFGGSGSESAYDVQQTTDGGYVVAGNTTSNDGDVSGNHGGGSSDAWVIKLNSAGVLQWQKTLGGINPDGAKSIQQTTDGGYIVAGATESSDGDVTSNHGVGFNDIWVVKLNSSGVLQWQKTFGGFSDEYSNVIQQTMDGGYVVVATTYSIDGDVSGNHGGGDIWVIKLNSTGSLLWQKALGGSLDEYGNAIQQTLDGGYIITGTTNSNNGNVSGSHGQYDVWVVKLNSSGILQWQKPLGGSSDDDGDAIRQTTDGGYIIAGFTRSNDGDVSGNHGGTDAWLVSLNSSGAIQWQKTFGGTFSDAANAMQLTADGGYISSGTTTSDDGDVTGKHGFADIWVVKLKDCLCTSTITPAGPTSSLCNGNTVVLNGPTTPGDSYQWQKNGTNITGATAATYTASTSGDYTLIVTRTGCTSTSTPITVSVLPPIQIGNISINALTGTFVLTGGQPATNGSNYSNVVMSLQGNPGVTTALAPAAFANNQAVSFIAPQAGTYLVVVTDAAGCSGTDTVVVSSGGTPGTAPCIEWQKALGGTGFEVANAIQQTTDGGYIVAGYTSSNDGDVTSNHGAGDAWVAKLNGTGAIQWQKTLGGSNYDEATTIQQTTDGGYIVAGYTVSSDGDVIGYHGLKDAWVVKLNGTGGIQWQKTLGGMAQDEANAIQQTTDGGYIVAIFTDSNDGDVIGNHGAGDAWVVKLSGTGGIQWQKTLGGTNTDAAKAIQQTTDGGYIVAGGTRSNDGDVIGFHGSEDAWVVKLNDTGGIQWQKTLGGTGTDWATAIQQTTDGGFIVAGYTDSSDGDVIGNHGSTDPWVVKLNGTGGIQWQKTLGGTGDERANAIQQTTDGGYIVAGYTSSNDGDVIGNHGVSDAWVVKLNGTGAIQWQKTLGGTSSEGATAIQQTTDGGYIVAGATNSNDGDVSVNHGSGDAWIVKLKDCLCTATITPTGPTSSLCNGSSVVLNGPITSGDSYQWQKDGANITGATAASYTASTAGDYTLIVTRTGCTSTSTPVTVFVLSPIQISNINTNALTGTFVLSGGLPATNGSNYANVVMSLQGNPGVTAALASAPFSNNQTVSFTAPQAGTYLVVATDAGGCSGMATIVVSSGTPGTAPCIEWQKALGGSNNDEADAIVQTSDGGYIIAGSTASNDGNVSGNHGVADAWVVKLNSSGLVTWQKTLGGSLAERLTSIQGTSDGGYIAAGYTLSTDGDVSGKHGSDDAWVVKLNSSGDLQWQKALGGNLDDWGTSIQPTADGGYIGVGYTRSTDGDVIGNHGSYDCWVYKLNSTGLLQWQKALGGTGSDYAYAIQATSDGGYIVAGSTQSNDGNVIGNHGSYDGWIVKLNASGNLIWQNALGGTNDDYAYNIKQTTDGGYIIAGTTYSNDGNVMNNHGGWDAWIVKLNGSGALQWQKTLGGTDDEAANAIQQTSDGGFIVAGKTLSVNGDISSNHGLDDVWAVKLDGSGNLLWQKTLGGSNIDNGIAIQATSDGGYCIAGYSNSTDGDVTGKHAGNDAWVVKLKDCSCIVSIISSGLPNPCTGDSVVLSTQTTAGNTYQWKRSGVNIAGATSASYTAYSSGIYSLVVTNTGCISTSVSKNISFWPPIQVSNITTNGLTGSFFLSGGRPRFDGSNYTSVVMSLQGNPGITATLSPAPFSNNQIASFTAPQTGIYQVTVTDTAGCSTVATEIVGGVSGSAPCIEWQKTLGGSMDEMAFDIQKTIDGGFIMAGSTTSNDGDISGNHGNGDAWVVKMDSLGVQQWQKVLGGTGFDEFSSIQQTTDGGFIMAGCTTSNDGDVSGTHGTNLDIWVVKLSNSGAVQWQKTLGGIGSERGRGIQQTTDGGYIIVGFTNYWDGDVSGYHVGNGNGYFDIWVVKLNSAGVLQWQKALGGSGNETATAIQQTTDGGYIIPGITNSIDGDVTEYHGGRDAWIVKINGSGAIQWQKTLGGTFDDYFDDIQKTADGGFILTGNTDSYDLEGDTNNSSYRAWTIKTNNAGEIQWQKTFGGADFPFSYSIQQTTDGGFVIAGLGNSSTSLDQKIIKINEFGDIQWQKTMGGSSGEQITAIRQTAGGGFIVAGNTLSNDGDVSGNHGGQDAWVVKLKDCSCTTAISPTGPISLCNGDSITLNTPTSTAITYQWQKDLSNISSATSSTYTATAPGSYTLVVTKTGCTATSTPVAVSVLPPIQINNITTNTLTGTFVIGGGRPATNASSYSALTMTLQNNPAVTATLSTAPFKNNQTVSFTAPQAGAYLVTATDTSGCAGTATITVIDNVAPGCNTVNDSLALVALYDSTDGSNWVHHANWKMPGQPPGTWYGITTNAQGCVIGISLDSNNLNGHLLPSLGNIAALKQLNLRRNPKVSGSIPAELGQLQKLEILQLDYDNLSGTIPASLGNLSKLTLLWLGDNANLGGPLPSSLAQLTSLQHFALQECQFSDKIPDWIGNLSELKTIGFQKNKFSGTIPASLGNLKHLRVLWLGDNQLTNPIPTTLGNLDSLETFSLYTNLFSGPAPAFFGTFKRLTQLYATINKFTSFPDMSAVPIALDNQSGHPPVVGGLLISDNRLTFDDILPNINKPSFLYAPQDSVFHDTTLTVIAGQNLDFSLDFDEPVTTNVYNWYKDGIMQPAQAQTGNNNLVINNLKTSYAGAWQVEVNNPNANLLKLHSRAIHIQVNCATPPVPTISGPAGLCSGLATLRATVNYQNYHWSNNSAADSIVINTPGIYIVTVTDANGCTGTTSKTIDPGNSAPMPQITGPTGLCSGAAQLSVAGNFQNIQWSNNASGASTVVNTPGNYTVVVTDGIGCTGTSAYMVSAGAPSPTPSIGGVTSICPNSTTTLTADSGFLGYAWSAGQQDTAAIKVGMAGTYTVTVTNSFGCTGTSSVQVSIAAAPVSHAQVTDANCGQSNGAVDLTVTGNGPFTYLWTTGSTSEDLTGVVADMYGVTVTNNAGCKDSLSVTVKNSDGPTGAIQTTQATCGLLNGAADLTPSGGISPYTYLWSSGATTQDLGNLNQGTYAVTITDGKGCTATASATIAASGSPALTADATPTGCLMPNGAIKLTVNGGAPGFSFNWSDQPANHQQDRSNLPAGTYVVTVTDNNGCTATASIDIAVTDGPSISTTPAPTSCAIANGGIQLSVVGGTPGYNYDWSDLGGSIDPKDRANLPVGTYTVTVTDLNGCSISATAVVSSNTVLSPIINGTTGFCTGGSTFLDAGAGYQCNWSTGENTHDITVKTAGLYIVTITSTAGCTATTSVTVVENPLPVVQAQSNSLVCQGDALQLSTGTGNGWVYQWTGPLGFTSGLQNPVRASAVPAMSGQYLLTVTDVNHCKATAAVPVRVAPHDTTKLTERICVGDQFKICDQAFISSGIFQKECTSFLGCDSTVILDLTVETISNAKAKPDSVLVLLEEYEKVFQVTTNDQTPANWDILILVPPVSGDADVPDRDHIRYKVHHRDFFGLDSLVYLIYPVGNCRGTRDSAKVYITVQGSYNVFTPNGDRHNETFDPLEIYTHFDPPAKMEEAEITILNRWGEVVFHRAPPNYEAWDGKNGRKDLPQGVYYFRLMFQSRIVEGAVHLLR